MTLAWPVTFEDTRFLMTSSYDLNWWKLRLLVLIHIWPGAISNELELVSLYLRALLP